jgi:hypothetical protein
VRRARPRGQRFEDHVSTHGPAEQTDAGGVHVQQPGPPDGAHGVDEVSRVPERTGHRVAALAAGERVVPESIWRATKPFSASTASWRASTLVIGSARPSYQWAASAGTDTKVNGLLVSLWAPSRTGAVPACRVWEDAGAQAASSSARPSGSSTRVSREVTAAILGGPAGPRTPSAEPGSCRPARAGGGLLRPPGAASGPAPRPRRAGTSPARRPTACRAACRSRCSARCPRGRP